MKPKKYNKDLIPLSRTLRKNMTKEEKHLWYDFLKPHPMNFYRQKVIGKYIADFYCPQANLIVELDGSQHYTEEGLENDAERTAFLSTYGLKTIRFTNGEILYKFKYVCDCINLIHRKRSLFPFQGKACEGLGIAARAVALIERVKS